ncbi:hypothetical protein ACKVMT_06985 [Halobacteriales archaeon Cl-PHB]
MNDVGVTAVFLLAAVVWGALCEILFNGSPEATQATLDEFADGGEQQ